MFLTWIKILKHNTWFLQVLIDGVKKKLIQILFFLVEISLPGYDQYFPGA